MADDKVAGKVDDRLIALRDPYELLYWTTAVGMSEEDLTKLLADHGRSGCELPLQDRKDQFP